MIRYIIHLLQHYITSNLHKHYGTPSKISLGPPLQKTIESNSPLSNKTLFYYENYIFNWSHNIKSAGINWMIKFCLCQYDKSCERAVRINVKWNLRDKGRGDCSDEIYDGCGLLDPLCNHLSPHRTILDINLGLYLVICSYLLSQLSTTPGILNAYSSFNELNSWEIQFCKCQLFDDIHKCSNKKG